MQLIKALGEQKTRWELAKVVVREEDGSLPEEPDVFLLDSENHFYGGHLSVHEIRAYCKDLVPLQHYRTYDALALPRLVRLDMIVGFKWLDDEEVFKYVDIHRLEELN
jgi:hypothetical protein